MLVEGRMHKVLKLRDINSELSLSQWLKTNLALYKEDEKISSNDLQTFLEYIKNKIKEQNIKNKKEWFDELDAISERI